MSVFFHGTDDDEEFPAVKKTIKICYSCKPYRGAGIGGIVDAGPGATATLEGDVLKIVGPKINYSIKNIASFTVEEVDE